MINSICIIVRKPKGEEQSTLGIRTAWAAHASAFDTNILFVEDGCYNVLNSTGYNTEMIKTYIKENGKICVPESCIKDRGLSERDFLNGIQVLSEWEVRELIQECDAVATF